MGARLLVDSIAKTNSKCPRQFDKTKIQNDHRTKAGQLKKKKKKNMIKLKPAIPLSLQKLDVNEMLDSFLFLHP